MLFRSFQFYRTVEGSTSVTVKLPRESKVVELGVGCRV